MENITKKSQSEIINDNQDFIDFVNQGDLDFKHIVAIITDIKEYAKYLLSQIKEEEEDNKLDFEEKCVRLLQIYKEDKFWLKDNKSAFLFLLNEIKKDRITLNQIQYFLPAKKILEGFTEYYHDELRDKVIIDEKRIELLKREKKLDEIIAILLNEQIILNQDYTKN